MSFHLYFIKHTIFFSFRNMRRPVTYWYTKEQPIFENTEEMIDCRIDVTRIPGGADTPPCRKFVTIIKLMAKIKLKRNAVAAHSISLRKVIAKININQNHHLIAIEDVEHVNIFFHIFWIFFFFAFAFEKEKNKMSSGSNKFLQRVWLVLIFAYSNYFCSCRSQHFTTRNESTNCSHIRCKL